jgi:hypothetical protein
MMWDPLIKPQGDPIYFIYRKKTNTDRSRTMARTNTRTRRPKTTKEVQLLSEVSAAEGILSRSIARGMVEAANAAPAREWSEEVGDLSQKGRRVVLTSTDWKGHQAEVNGERIYQNTVYLMITLTTFANGKLRPEGRRLQKMVLPTSVETIA